MFTAAKVKILIDSEKQYSADGHNEFCGQIRKDQVLLNMTMQEGPLALSNDFSPDR